MFRYQLAFLIFFLCAAQTSSGEHQYKQVSGAMLQSEISTQGLSSPTDSFGRVQPGTDMRLTAVVKNVGDIPSGSGTIRIRFALPKPRDKTLGSVLYETETKELPVIEPGKAVTIHFHKPHQWPSLFDFVRQDWNSRQYEAVVTIQEREVITGTKDISFSAYYYEGDSTHDPVWVSSAEI